MAVGLFRLGNGTGTGLPNAVRQVVDDFNKARGLA